MKIYMEMSLENFEAWSGARDTLDTLIEKDLVDQLESIIDDEDISGSEGWSDTSLNDFLWFETDTIAEWLGFRDWEDLLNDGEEDEEDKEDQMEELEQAINEGQSFKEYCGCHTCEHCPLFAQDDCETWYNAMLKGEEE